MNDVLRKLFRTDIGWIVLVGVVLVVVQIVATFITAAEIERTSERIAADLAKLQATTLTDEKTRQEVLNLRIQNQIKGLLSNNLVVGIGPMVTAFVALVGALLGLRNFLASREKERLDRASNELKDTMDRLVKGEPWQRAAGVLGLQHFLSPAMRDYHLRAASALAMAARLEADADVRDTIRIAVEQAVRTVDEGVLQQVSWQWAKLADATLAGRSLRGLDWRNAVLDDGDLRRCDLGGSLFTNAKLKGAKLDRSRLAGADLSHADLAGASLVDADLTGASLYHAKVMRMDVSGADLRGAQLDADEMPWEMILHWRRAKLDDALRAMLIERYGPEPSGPKVAMLMWELPPFVAGGTWTACYHLVRNLRRRGADVTVIVPWAERLVQSLPFGAEVRVVALGIVPPELEAGDDGVAGPYPASWSGYGAASAYAGARGMSPYGGAPSWSAYGGAPSWSPYGGAPSWSPYGGAPSWSPYGSGGALWSSYGAPSWSPYGTAPRRAGAGAQPMMRGPSPLLRLIDDCRRRFLGFLAGESFDVVHAHDWVTFEAAGAASRDTGVPWIAHFHSIEIDRRPDAPDLVIERIERRALAEAQAVVAPSRVTASRIAERYGVPPERVSVVPNTLSPETIAPGEMGLNDGDTVLFLGRLTAQKGPDLYAAVAQRVRHRLPHVRFEARGEGEPTWDFLRHVDWRGRVEWSQRGRAFRDCSALLVPSRSEPFGMVILEAMQRRVPVLYPRDAGAAEVLDAGIKIVPTDVDAVAEALVALLTDRNRWEEVVMRQADEVQAYADRGHERTIQALYGRVARPHAEGAVRSPPHPAGVV